MGDCGSVLTILLTHGTKYINCFTSNTGISESYGFMGDTSGKTVQRAEALNNSVQHR